MEKEPTHRVVVEIPESWLPELEAAKKRLFTSRHGFILRSIRRALDGENVQTKETQQ